MNNIRTRIIACKTVIQEMGELIPPGVAAYPVESGLHLNPDKLRNALQAVIDETTGDTETIILGYGLCSMGVVGLKATDSALVVPRQEDCISLFLGSRERYRKELEKEPGTYFLSKGWIDAGITLLEELRGMEERYGREWAHRIMKRMIQHYTRLAFIDTGHEDQGDCRAYARKVADELDLTYQEIRGTRELLERICKGPWDDDEFIVAPPGHTICLGDFGMVPAGVEQPSGPSIGQNRVKAQL